MEGPKPPVKRTTYHIKPHGAYPLYVCGKCGFAQGASNWRKHRRVCTGRKECSECRGVYPCTARTCRKREINRVQIPRAFPGLAPRRTALDSLDMCAERRNGLWYVRYAHEQAEDIPPANTWEEGYWAAVKRRHSKWETGYVARPAE